MRPFASRLIAVSPKNIVYGPLFHYFPQFPTERHNSACPQPCQAIISKQIQGRSEDSSARVTVAERMYSTVRERFVRTEDVSARTMPRPPQTRDRGGRGPAGGEKERRSRPVSRVLSETVIHLGPPSPAASSGLPGCGAGHAIASLFGLASSGVYRAVGGCPRRGALLPHLFTLTAGSRRRSVFCGTFRRLAPPRRYLAPCPAKPGLSSAAPTTSARQRLSGRLLIYYDREFAAALRNGRPF